jgi:YHS domain-containing protein
MSLTRWFVLSAMLALGFSISAAEEPKKKDPKDMNADEANEAGLCPVCKGEFKPVYHVEYKDKEYKFRTRECSKKFAANPTSFGAMGKDWKPAATDKPADDKNPPKKDDKKPK